MSFKLFPAYLASIFFTVHYATTLYVNSTFLGGFFPASVVSLLYALGSLLSIGMFMQAPELLARFGYRRFLVFISILLFAATAGLATASSVLVAGLSFVLYGAVYLLMYFALDVYIEEHSSRRFTGGIRGAYLTLVNAAIAVSPLMVAIVSRGWELSSVYAYSLFFLIPVVVIAVFSIHPRTPSRHIVHSLPFGIWRRAINVRRVTVVRFILEFFFAVMVIFTPLYLFSEIGFDWREIGIMFSIMLLPFVILQWPAGMLADKLFGEKEMMSLGLFFSGSALLILPFLDKNFIAWTSALFLSRVGASLVEIMTESYFFKHVDARDSGLISIFRISRPLATIAGAIVGGLIYLFFSIPVLFLVMAAIVFLGLRQSALLKDTL